MRVITAALMALTLGLCSHVAADGECIPHARGVPGNLVPPQWWTGGVAPLGDGFEDARWQGAFGVGYGGAATHFRALRNQEGTTKYLYLAWQVGGDPEGSAPSGAIADRLRVGISNAAGTEAFRLTFALNTSAVVDQVGLGAPAMASATTLEQLERWTGTTWENVTETGSSPPVPPRPSWLKDFAFLRVECPVAGGCAAGTKWTFQLRVPVAAAAAPVVTGGQAAPTAFDAGFAFDDDVRIWHRAEAAYQTPPTPIAQDVVIAYDWPESASITGLPDPSAWHSVNVSKAVTDPTCTRGIALATSGVRTDNPTSGTRIDPVTTFQITPFNYTGANVDASQIQATVRIADWGSSGVGDNAQWTTTCTATSAAATVADGSPINLTCPWNVPDICDYIDTGTCAGAPLATHYFHQCILTQLRQVSTTDAGEDGGPNHFLFTPESVWQNMNLAEASTVERIARVSIKGFPNLGRPRDVYLYVEALNMPAPPATGDNQNPDRKPLQQPLDPKVARNIATGRITEAALDRLMPTYRIHVFHDTGATRDLGGGKLAQIVRAQPYFGLYLYHQGDFDGWKRGLEGQGGVVLTTLDEGRLYKLSMADDSAVQLKVTAQTLPDTVRKDGVGGSGGDAGVGGSGGGCEPGNIASPWLLLLLLIAFLIVVVLLRRR